MFTHSDATLPGHVIDPSRFAQLPQRNNSSFASLTVPNYTPSTSRAVPIANLFPTCNTSVDLTDGSVETEQSPSLQNFDHYMPLATPILPTSPTATIPGAASINLYYHSGDYAEHPAGNHVIEQPPSQFRSLDADIFQEVLADISFAYGTNGVTGSTPYSAAVNSSPMHVATTSSDETGSTDEANSTGESRILNEIALINVSGVTQIPVAHTTFPLSPITDIFSPWDNASTPPP